MSDASNALAVVESPSSVPAMAGFFSASGFELLQRVAKVFSTSSMVPAQYQDNLPNSIIALEMAQRMGASPLLVMQNLYIVHGNPGWSSKFLIACFNQCGRFSSLRYEFDRDAKNQATGCRAWAVEKSTGERLTGATITVAMAQAEGWATKAGSKWKTMPEQMLIYRAAAFFIRSYAPEISMGLQTSEELIDVDGVEVEMPRRGKPAVEMPVEVQPAVVIDQATGEITPQQAQDAPQGAPDDHAAPAAAPRASSGALASDGERKMIVTRAKNAGLSLRSMLDAAGLSELPDDLAGLSKDGWVALKDQLPKVSA